MDNPFVQHHRHRAVSKSIGNYSSTKTGPMPSAPAVHCREVYSTHTQEYGVIRSDARDCHGTAFGPLRYFPDWSRPHYIKKYNH